MKRERESFECQGISRRRKGEAYEICQDHKVAVAGGAIELAVDPDIK